MRLYIRYYNKVSLDLVIRPRALEPAIRVRRPFIVAMSPSVQVRIRHEAVEIHLHRQRHRARPVSMTWWRV